MANAEDLNRLTSCSLVLLDSEGAPVGERRVRAISQAREVEKPDLLAPAVARAQRRAERHQ